MAENLNLEKLLTDTEIQKLIAQYYEIENDFRTLSEMINDGEFPELKGLTLQKGKVSDSLYGEDFKNREGLSLRIMVRTSRISTHDENRGIIPFKDQILALNHDFMLSVVKDILGSAQIHINSLDPRTCVVLAENTKAPVYENVLRRYMAKTSTMTSLYQAWLKAKNNSDENFSFAGRDFQTNELDANCKLSEIIDTPSTKAGDDITRSPEYFIEKGLVSREEYEETRDNSMKAFFAISNTLKRRGVAFVDTKTEHGKNSQGNIVAIDELYTMDSSRFWILDDSGDILLIDDEPVQIGKENARKRVKEKGQQFTRVEADEIAFDYIKGYQRLTGKRFSPDMRFRVERYKDGFKKIFENI